MLRAGNEKLSVSTIILVRNFLYVSQITEAEIIHQKACVFGSHPTPAVYLFLRIGQYGVQSDLLSRSTVILNLTLNCVCFQPLLISFIIDS